MPGRGSRSMLASTVTWLARTPAPASTHSRETTKAQMPMATARFHDRSCSVGLGDDHGRAVRRRGRAGWVGVAGRAAAPLGGAVCP